MRVLRRPARGPVQAPPGAGRDVRCAWVSLALVPVAFVGAMFLGEWLLSLQGYGTGEEAVPVSVALWAGGPAMLLLIAPGAAAIFFGLRARRRGRPAGLTPAIIGAAAVLGSIALNTLAFVVGP